MNIIDVFQPLRVSIRVSAGLLILRLVAGLAFLFHGYGKITNPFGWMPPDSGVAGILQALLKRRVLGQTPIIVRNHRIVFWNS